MKTLAFLMCLIAGASPVSPVSRSDQCLAQPGLVEAKPVAIEKTSRAEQQGLRVVYSYQLKSCLAEMAVSTQNEVILLTDGSRVFVKDGKPEKTKLGNYWDPEAPEVAVGPFLDGSRAISTALVSRKNISGRSIEGWVGTWKVKGGSTVAFFTKYEGGMGKPQPLFFVNANVSNVRIGVASVDMPDVVLSFLADDLRSGKLAVSMYWRIDKAFD